MAKKSKPASDSKSVSASASESSGSAKSRRRSGGSGGSGGSTLTADKPSPSNLPPLAKIQGFVIVTIPRSQIKNAAYNPRVISPAQRRKLTASLKKFRLVEPLVWNVRTGNLVGGHQRLTVIDALEGTADYSLTVARIDVDEATEKALNIALNNPESQGQYDMDLLADVIRDLHAEDNALVQDAGFDASNLSMLFGDSFLTGQAAEQAAADVQLVDELNQMYEAGAEEEKKRKAASSAQKNAQFKGTGSPDAGSPGSPDTGSPDTGSPGSSDSSHSSDADPSDENLPSGDSQSSAEEPKKYGKAGWTKEDFKARRDEYRSQRSTLDDASIHLTIVFDSSDQLGSFLSQLGLDPNLDMIDAFTILPLLGVDMGDGEEGDGEEGEGEQDDDGHDGDDS